MKAQRPLGATEADRAERSGRSGLLRSIRVVALGVATAVVALSSASGSVSAGALHGLLPSGGDTATTSPDLAYHDPDAGSAPTSGASGSSSTLSSDRPTEVATPGDPAPDAATTTVPPTSTDDGGNDDAGTSTTEAIDQTPANSAAGAVAPTARSGSVSSSEDEEVTVVLRATSDRSVTFDVPTPPRHLDLVDGPPLQPIEPVDGAATVEVTLLPSPDWSGTDSLSLEACSDGVCDEASVVVQVRAVNDAPELSGPTTLDGTEGMAILPLQLSVSDVDDATEGLETVASGLPAGLRLDDGLRLTGTPSESGQFDVSIVTTDPDGAEATHALTIMIGSAASQPTLAITEVLYAQTDLETPFAPGTQDEFVEITNLGADPVDLTGYRLVDFDPSTGARDVGEFWGSIVDRSIDRTLGSDDRGGGAILEPGAVAVVWVGDPDRTSYTETVATFGDPYVHTFSLRAFAHAPSAALEFVDAGNPWGSLGSDGDDLWLLTPDGSVADYVAWNGGPGDEREFSAHPGGAAWNPGGEASLAALGDGTSLALGTSTITNGTGCWTASGTRPPGCGEPRTTRDVDEGVGGERRSSVGRTNFA